MPGWVFLLIAVTGYATGFLITGAVLAHTMNPDVRRCDFVWAMIGWPMFGPCYGVYRAVLTYVEFLERTLTERRSRMPLKNVTKLPRVVTPGERWD